MPECGPEHLCYCQAVLAPLRGTFGFDVVPTNRSGIGLPCVEFWPGVTPQRCG
jgi:hypothetical protein